MWPSSSRSMLKKKSQKMSLKYSTLRHTEAEAEITQLSVDHTDSKEPWVIIKKTVEQAILF